ncbi:ATP-binding cassette domain-containing protein [Streptomyces sp. SID3343]|uniref:ATP-binding cassette domain-containing protein n=1 Tax=Streptomyces sp. SID3343 TaxID=2690260 RepID=UPI00136B8347|nr:ATP-binding cassette domain-containing protein [Streptomyces sp. SID3343]
MSTATSGVEIVAVGLAAHGPDGTIFSGVDLTAPAAGLTVVAGPGGAGRTSLLLALGGRFRTSAGSVTVDGSGRPAIARQRTAVARARPGLDLEEHLTVAETVAERRAIGAGRPTAFALERMYDLVRIEPPAHLLVEHLSAVEHLLFSIALAAATHPGAILVDDVDTAIAGADLSRAWRALRDIADYGITVVATATAPPPRGAERVVDLPGHHLHARPHLYPRGGIA